MIKFAECVTVLGTPYAIEVHKYEDDPILENADGYCDKTSKLIVIADISKKESDLDNIKVHQKKILRHEIVHAFLFESGLWECANFASYDGKEQLVDWIAYQGIKIYTAWKEARAL